MTCQAAQELILENLDCRIDEEQQIRLESHLAQCDMCRSFWEAQRDLDAALAAHCVAPELSDAFRSRLAQKIRGEKKQALQEWLPRPAPSWRRNCGHGSLLSVAACCTRRGLYRWHRINVFQLCPADGVSVLVGRLGGVVGRTGLPGDSSRRRSDPALQHQLTLDSGFRRNHAQNHRLMAVESSSANSVSHPS